MSNKIYRCRFEETNPKVNLLSSIHANLQIINLWKVSLSYLKITKTPIVKQFWIFFMGVLPYLKDLCTRWLYFLHKLHHFMGLLNMVVIDLNATNSTFYDSETVLNIVYECSSVYLAFIIIVGIGLNSKALSLLIRANQVRNNGFWSQVFHSHLIVLDIFVRTNCQQISNYAYFRLVKPNKTSCWSI